MKKLFVFVLLIVGLGILPEANAGAVRFAGKAAKSIAKAAVYPFAHPKKDAKAAGHAAKAVGKVVY